MAATPTKDAKSASKPKTYSNRKGRPLFNSSSDEEEQLKDQEMAEPEQSEDEDSKKADSDDENGEEEYEIEAIIKHQRGYFKAGNIGYFVHWKGYPASEDSWVDESDAGGAQDLIDEYWRKQNEKKSSRKSTGSTSTKKTPTVTKGRKSTGTTTTSVRRGTSESLGAVAAATSSSKPKPAPVSRKRARADSEASVSPMEIDSEEEPVEPPVSRKKAKKDQESTSTSATKSKSKPSANGTTSKSKSKKSITIEHTRSPSATPTNDAARVSEEPKDAEDDQPAGEEKEAPPKDALTMYSHLDSWDDIVSHVLTCERRQEEPDPRALDIFWYDTKGRHLCSRSEDFRVKAPQKLIEFYESNLKWRQAEPSQ